MVLRSEKEIQKWLNDPGPEYHAIGSALSDPQCAVLLAKAPDKYFATKLGIDCQKFIRSELGRGAVPSLVSAASYGVIQEYMIPQLEDSALLYVDQFDYILLILRDKAMFRIIMGFPSQLKRYETIDEAATALVDEVQSFSVLDRRGSVEAPEIADGVESLFLPADAFTGVSGVDDMLSIRKGNLVIVAGRPAVGKSWLGLQVCGRTLKLGGSALFVSLEMSELEVGKRLSMQAGVPQTVDGVRDYLSRCHGFYINTHAHTPEAIRREIGRLGGVDVVVVDYLQLMSPDVKKAQFSRNDEMAAVSRGLKRLAVDLSVPIVAICQLNRQGAGRPALHHIRDSGAIEADADAVVMLYDSEGSLICEVKKNRHGRTGLSFVTMDSKVCRLY